MPIVTADFETYYSKDYSLSRLSEIEYILSSQFQSIMCAVKLDHGPSEVFVGHDAIAHKLSTFDWSRTCFLAHNTRFDGSILLWHYGITPAMYLDTLSMARALTHSKIGSSSLKKVSEYLGLPAKGTEVHDNIGKYLEDFTEAELCDYANYCRRDNDNCRAIFDIFMKVFPKPELELIDIFLRMFIEPSVHLDAQKLLNHAGNVRAEAAQTMAKVAHLDKSVFSSNQKFSKLLEEQGVEVPQKVSLTTGEWIPAVAKNDRAFKALCADESQPLEVQALLAARLSIKSTIEETRTLSLLKVAQTTWPSGDVGWAPVPMKYYGAHTGRVSGDGGVNWLNFKRGSQIRAAVRAPDGYRIVHRDASQIEARMVAWLARCWKLLRAFEEGRDVYSEFASKVYGVPVTKADVRRRHLGKTCILGLSYNTGPEKLRHTLYIGNGGPSVDIDLEEATRIVKMYRYQEYPEIPHLWQACGDVLAQVMSLGSPIGPQTPARTIDALVQTRVPAIEAGAGAIWLPNGMCIAYPNLRIERANMANGQVQNEMVYDGPYGKKRIYGGKACENVSQALSRIVITDVAVRVKRQTGFRPFMHTYDSLDWCVPVEEAPAFDVLVAREFSLRPAWAPDLPLASEGGWGVTMLDAEKGVNQ